MLINFFEFYYLQFYNNTKQIIITFTSRLVLVGSLASSVE